MDGGFTWSSSLYQIAVFEYWSISGRSRIEPEAMWLLSWLWTTVRPFHIRFPELAQRIKTVKKKILKKSHQTNRNRFSGFWLNWKEGMKSSSSYVEMMLHNFSISMCVHLTVYVCLLLCVCVCWSVNVLPCLLVSASVLACLWEYVSASLSVCMCMYSCLLVCVFALVYVCVCTVAYLSVCVYLCMLASICVCLSLFVYVWPNISCVENLSYHNSISSIFLIGFPNGISFLDLKHPSLPSRPCTDWLWTVRKVDGEVIDQEEKEWEGNDISRSLP